MTTESIVEDHKIYRCTNPSTDLAKLAIEQLISDRKHTQARTISQSSHHRPLTTNFRTMSLVITSKKAVVSITIVVMNMAGA